MLDRAEEGTICFGFARLSAEDNNESVQLVQRHVLMVDQMLG